MKVSARNQFKGKIVSVNEGAINTIISLDIGGGNIITSTISKSAAVDLQLEVGLDAYAIIKATSVIIGIDD